MLVGSNLPHFSEESTFKHIDKLTHLAYLQVKLNAQRGTTQRFRDMTKLVYRGIEMVGGAAKAKNAAATGGLVYRGVKNNSVAANNNHAEAAGLTYRGYRIQN